MSITRRNDKCNEPPSESSAKSVESSVKPVEFSAKPSLERLMEEPLMAALIKAGTLIKGLDIYRSLGKLNWDREIWIKVARSFTNTMPSLLEILKDTAVYTGEANLPKYTITVHGIKSVCYSLGAFDAGDMAKELEKRAQAEDSSFIQENTRPFISMMEELLEGFGELLEKITVKIEKPLKEKPDREVLAKILEAAENYDIRNLEEGIAALEEYVYQKEPDLVPWLREQCEGLEFEAIKEHLLKLQIS